MNELEFTNDTNACDEKNCVERYIDRLIAIALQGDMQGYHLEAAAVSSLEHPVLTIHDEENEYTAELRRENNPDYTKYVLTVAQADGNVTMCSTDWVISPESTSPLQHLYACLTDLLAQPEDGSDDSTAETTQEEAEREAELIDSFVQALIADAKSTKPAIKWERVDAESNELFVARGFGAGANSIYLSKDQQDEDGNQFTLRYEQWNGDLIFSSMESSLASVTTELGILYQLISATDAPKEADSSKEDVVAFIRKARYAAFFDALVVGDFPNICQSNPETGENMLLVHDIFVDANLTAAVRCFLDGVKERHPELPPSRMLQLQTQAECLGKIIRHTTRCPNGSVFTSNELPSTFRGDTRWQGARTTAADSASRVANSWVTWPADIYGNDSGVPIQRIMTKCAVLLLAALMREQLL